jgi:hypothetical protein
MRIGNRGTHRVREAVATAASSLAARALGAVNVHHELLHNVLQYRLAAIWHARADHGVYHLSCSGRVLVKHFNDGVRVRQSSACERMHSGAERVARWHHETNAITPNSITAQRATQVQSARHSGIDAIISDSITVQ